MGIGPCGSSSVSTQFLAGPRLPPLRMAPERAPICPCLYLCLSFTCRNGPLYSSQAQGYSIHIHKSQFVHVCCLLPTTNLLEAVLNAHHGFLNDCSLLCCLWTIVRCTTNQFPLIIFSVSCRNICISQINKQLDIFFFSMNPSIDVTNTFMIIIYSVCFFTVIRHDRVLRLQLLAKLSVIDVHDLNEIFLFIDIHFMRTSDPTFPF